MLDVGAGTGIATRAMMRRGARVVASDIDALMLRRLRSREPAPSVAVARAEQLPLRDGSVDLVTSAQAWHWVEVERGTAEVARVLRPGGAVAVWWNVNVPAPWYLRQRRHIAAYNPAYDPALPGHEESSPFAGTGLAAGATVDDHPRAGAGPRLAPALAAFEVLRRGDR